MHHVNRFLLVVKIFLVISFPAAALADFISPAVVPQIRGEGEADKLQKLKSGAMVTGSAAVVEEIPRFNVTRFNAEGNTILPVTEIDAILARFTGKGKDFGDVQQAIETLEDAYRSRGFHAVRVLLPEQELRDGEVTLRIVEARIGKVVIEGNNYFDANNIRRTVTRLKEGAFPEIDRISAQIRVANENPSKKMQMQLEEGEADDKVNAVVKVVDERPWKIGSYIEDTGTKATGVVRLGLLAQHANLFNLDHLLTLQYITSPDHIRQVNIYSLGYRIPFYAWGDSLDLYAGYSNVDSGTINSGILNLAVSGKGSFGGFRYNMNLMRLGSYEHKIITGFDYRLFENNVLLAGTQLGSNIETHEVMLGYAGAFSGAFGEAGFWLNVSRNIPGDGKDSKALFERTRIGATDDFMLYKAGVNAIVLLPADWQGRFAATGQYSPSALIPSEQFGIGGQSSVRGFGEREYSDDIGMAGSVELYTPNLIPFAGTWQGQLRTLAFYDAGYLARNKPQPGERKNSSIGSTGMGLRFNISKYLSAGTDYAVITKPESGHGRFSGRWHFRVQLAF